MHPLGANQSWFTFSTAAGTYAVYAFTGTERVNEPFTFVVDFVSPDSALPTASFLGSDGLLSIADRSGGCRLVHGVIGEIRQMHTGHRFTHYQCVLVPRLRFLQETVNHRIYQSKTVVQIIDDVLREQRFSPELYEFRLIGNYAPRDYCTQYGESDYHFLCRLCEEEGIAFFFEHSEARHCLVLTDMPGGRPISGEADIRFFPGSGGVPDGPVISRIAHQQRISGDKAAYREWNPLTPSVDLEASQETGSGAPAPSGMELESYRFPHIYQTVAEGERYAKIQLARQLVYCERLEGTTDVSRMTPGQVFGMHDHPRADLNRPWWLCEVVHRGEQPAVLEEEAPEDRGLSYAAEFVAIPVSTRFVPALRHEKRRIMGVQSALVTGPAGEEIHTDQYGRVKVYFFWDRRDKEDDTASCWLRVAQGWAGNGFGSLAIPRVGSEVLVSFLEGDPDRPVVTGRVYHADMGLPCDLPSGKTTTVLRTSSSPGGYGANELRIEDKKMREEIYVHAERDMNFDVGNDWTENIQQNRSCSVEGSLLLNVQGETHEYYEGIRKVELEADDHLTLHASRQEKIDQKWLVNVGKEVHIKAGAKLVLEAGTGITIKAGSSFIKLDPSGVHLKGRIIGLNSGGSPLKCTVAKPEEPKEVQDSPPDAPSSKNKKRRKKSRKRSRGGRGGGASAGRSAQAQTLSNAQKAAQPLASSCKEKSGGKK